MRNLYIIMHFALYTYALTKRWTLVISERLTKMAEKQEESVRLTEDMHL